MDIAALHACAVPLLSEQADAQATAQKGSAVSAQGAQQGVSAVADAAGAVIQGNGVKGGFGGALQHAGNGSDCAVRAVAVQQTFVYRKGAAAGNGADQCQRDALGGKANGGQDGGA